MKSSNTKEKHMTDRAFSRLMLTSVIGIVVCIACLCSSSWAWFTESVPNTGNSIATAGDCLLSYTVTNELGEEVAGLDTGALLEAGSYRVTLSLEPDTASGYCIITAGGVEYYTDYILRHTSAGAEQISFDLELLSEQTVTFTARWGVFSRASSVSGGKLVIP